MELDEQLASRAAQSAKSTGLGKVVVRRGDAGDPATFRDVVPVDVLMLCGVFGNVEHPSVRDTVRALPALVVPGGYVIWTRGGGPPEDHRREVRRWFVEAGMPEVSFDGEPETYGVGVNQILCSRAAVQAGRLFTFRAPSDQASA